MSGDRTGPLRDCVVVDLTQFLAGPFATQLLADMGALVIKVEPPAGDSTRRLPPYFVGEDSAYYLSANRSKRSVVLDLKRKEGREVLLELVRRADVVMENFRPGVMERLGVGYEQLRAVNEAIVMCSISGFGRDGPYRDRPAYDAIVQAVSGTMSITGEPGRSPVRLGVPLGDVGAALYAASGTLAALWRRERDGVGEHVEVAMLDAQVALLSYQAVYYLVSGDVPGPQGRGHVSIPTYRSFTCGDGLDVMITANTERMWRAMCEVLGLPELADDPRFATNADRLANREALWAVLEPAFAAEPSLHWLPRLHDAGVPAAPVNTIAQALDDPHVIGRGMVSSLEGENGDRLRLVGSPVRFAAADERAPEWPPRLGEDSAWILRELLGLTEERVEEMMASGAVG